MELIVGNIGLLDLVAAALAGAQALRGGLHRARDPLYGPDMAPSCSPRSRPSGKVPRAEGRRRDASGIRWPSRVWCAERFPNAKLWPADAHARWLARSVACEMHSSFMALRNECGMGPDAAGVIHTMVGPDRAPTPTRRGGRAPTSAASSSVVRDMRARFGAGGPYLFGEWSMPDAFFTPAGHALPPLPDRSGGPWRRRWRGGRLCRRACYSSRTSSNGRNWLSRFGLRSASLPINETCEPALKGTALRSRRT